MKQERLLSLLIYLSRRRKATAPELADYLEVSRRTVNRDMESLCQAGVPLITTQGRGGGISLPEGYVLEKGLFPADEIDLYSFYKESQVPKLSLIKEAVRGERDIRFSYFGEKGKSIKTVRPVRIIYRWGSWYMEGYCRKREAYRLYKINRLWEPALLEKGPPPADLPADSNQKDIFPRNYHLKALFQKSAAGILVEEYGPSVLEDQQNGRILFERPFSNYSYMKRWILGFGDKAEVLGPEILKNDLKEITRSLEKIYFPN